MNIYFACSITGGREFERIYQSIVQGMLADGHEVPTAHLAQDTIQEMELVVTPAEVYARDVAWIRSADRLVAEISTPSHGVGYEIGYALALGKPVLACYRRDRKISKMISGNPDPGLVLRPYDETGDAVRVVREFLSVQYRI